MIYLARVQPIEDGITINGTRRLKTSIDIVSRDLLAFERIDDEFLVDPLRQILADAWHRLDDQEVL